MPFVLGLRISPASLTAEMGGMDIMKTYPDFMWPTTPSAPDRTK